MNREKFAWMTSIVLIALLAFQIPRTLARRDDDYTFVRTLIDIHRQVATNYVEPINEDELQQGAIDGMLGKLDPYSVYVPPARQEAFDQLLEGSFKGVGIQLDQSDNGEPEVVSPIDDSPAFKAGILAGDRILKVNGEDIHNLRLAEVIKKIAGPIGSDVSLTRAPHERRDRDRHHDPPGDRGSHRQGVPAQRRQLLGLFCHQGSEDRIPADHSIHRRHVR